MHKGMSTVFVLRVLRWERVDVTSKLGEVDDRIYGKPSPWIMVCDSTGHGLKTSLLYRLFVGYDISKMSWTMVS
jgi:hypothetical protein